MMRKVLVLLIVLAIRLTAGGQGQGYVNVTATKACYANGSVNAAFVNQSGSNQLPLLSGSVFPTTGTTNFNSSGVMSFFLADNSQVIPSPSQWTITACSSPGGQPLCGTTNVTVTGTVPQDISTQLAAFPCPNTGGGQMVYPPAGIAVSTGTQWNPSIDPTTVAYRNQINNFTMPNTFSFNANTGFVTPPSGLSLMWNLRIGNAETDFINTVSTAAPSAGGFTWYNSEPGVDMTSTSPYLMNLEPNGELWVGGVNNVQNPLTLNLADIGADINAAVAGCASNFPCHILIPPQTNSLQITTPIVLGSNTTVECASSGFLQNSFTGNTPTQLVYDGTGTAVTMNGNGSSWKGCSLFLAGTVTNGFLIGGNSNVVDGVTIAGGSGTTIDVRISGTNTENNHLQNSRIVNFMGTAVQVDHANDTFLDNITAYGVANGQTSTTLMIDSLAGGTEINNFVGGSSGAHGLVVRNTIAPLGNPTWIFARNFESDCSSGAGWLFDSTLTGAMVGATFTDSWSSGSGSSNVNCDQTVNPGVPGIEISGGANINIMGSMIRSNSGDGILVDGFPDASIMIQNNLITGNGFCPSNTCTPVYSGVHITAATQSILITGNSLSNTGNTNENQLYGVDNEAQQGLIQISGNLCTQNKSQCINPNYAAVQTATRSMIFGNSSTTDPQAPDQRMIGDLSIWSGKVGAYIAPHVVPDYAAANAFLMGLGGNLRFDGTNWQTGTDGTNNAAFGYLGNNTGDGYSCIYSIPTGGTPATSGQTIPQSSIQNYCLLQFTNTGITSTVPITSPSTLGGTPVTLGASSGGAVTQSAHAAGCTTAATADATCTTTVKFAAAFKDTSYDASCTGQGPGGPSLAINGYTIQDAQNVIVTTVTNTAAATSYGQISCVAVHN